MTVQPSQTQHLELLPTPPASPDHSPDAVCCDGCAATPENPSWARAARYARLLSWASLIWMTGEGALGLIAGLQAGSISMH